MKFQLGKFLSSIACFTTSAASLAGTSVAGVAALTNKDFLNPDGSWTPSHYVAAFLGIGLYSVMGALSTGLFANEGIKNLREAFGYNPQKTVSAQPARSEDNYSNLAELILHSPPPIAPQPAMQVREPSGEILPASGEIPISPAVNLENITQTASQENYQTQAPLN